MITKLNDNSEQILRTRYYLEGEDWPKLCERVTKNVVPNSCSMYPDVYSVDYIDTVTQSCYDLINNLYFIPNSPTMFNAGTKTPMLSACFIIDVPDDLAGIFESVKESALIHKMGGGVGFSLFRLRAKGSKISTTHGSSSGPVSFLIAISDGTRPITAGGRRKGANMAMMRIDHPDILEFVSCKAEEGRIDNFNLSVQFTDKFMSALEKGLDFDLIDPKDGLVVKTVKATDLMSNIVHYTWKNGEPGACFIDTVNKDNPTPHLGPITSSNPCQPKWATVLTPTGISTFEKTNVGDTIWSGKRWTKVVKKVCTGTKDVYAYRTRAGVFYGTDTHRVVEEGEKIEVCKAEAIDVCPGPLETTVGFIPELIMDGLVFGDGMYHGASNKVVLLVGNNDTDYFTDKQIGTLFIEPRPGIKEKSWEVVTSFKYLPLTYNRCIPDSIRFGTAHEKESFLRGLYSANGSVVGRRVTLKSASLPVVEVVQEMLSSLGIVSYYTVNKSKDVEFSNGTYTCRQSYDLNIGNEDGRDIFASSIGFIQHYKMGKLLSACRENICRKVPKRTFDIIERELVSSEEVYDITVDADEHTYWTGGLLVSNCGEFYSIPYNSCNLGSLNLTKYVEDGKFNWELFIEHIKLATFYLDCIVDANKYPLEKIDAVTRSTRPLGLGVLGFADMLIMMGIKYDSGAAFGMAERLAEYLSFYSMEASVELAKKRGPYPEFKPENHTYPNFVKNGRLNWKGMVKNIQKFGLRNSHTTVLAPTGTIARIANEVSFGIEPLFEYHSISKILDGQEIEFVHPLYRDFKEGKLDVPEDVFVRAGDIDWKDHIEMQSRWQMFTHNGISKTINMKEGTTEAEVADVYMYAYKKGLKGLTLYVAGSREKEVIVSADKDKTKKNTAVEKQGSGRRPKDIDLVVLKKLAVEEDMTANKLSDIFDCSISTIRRRLKELNIPVTVVPDKIKLPDEIDCKRYRIPTPAGKAFIEIGFDEDTKMPIETIVSMSKSGSYDNAMAEALGKMISKALQHRMDVYEVIETLKDIMGGDSVEWWEGMSVKSVPDAVAKALSRYMDKQVPSKKRGRKSVSTSTSTAVAVQASETSTKKCIQCGAPLVPSEGCWKCMSCDWSKCG